MRVDPNVRRQVELQLLGTSRLLLAAGVVGDAVDRHAVLVGRMPRIQTAAVIWYSGVPTLLPARSRRLADPARRVDVDARVPEEARREHRDGDERPVGREQRHHVGRQRHLRGVELAVPQHPEERLLDRQVQVVEVDAVGLDAPLEQRAGPVVVPARQRQSESAPPVVLPFPRT